MVLATVKFTLKLSIIFALVGLFFNLGSVVPTWLTAFPNFYQYNDQNRAALCFTIIAPAFGFLTVVAGIESGYLVFLLSCEFIRKKNISSMRKSS